MDVDALKRPLWAWPWVAYVVALAGPVLALWLRQTIGGSLAGYPYVSFFLVVMIAALLGGWKPGLIAAALSGVLASTYLDEPVYSFRPLSPSGWVGMSFFVLVSTCIIFTVHLLQGMKQTLERRIADATRSLALANEQLRTEIATRENAQAQVRQAQKMEAVGQLTGGVAHDFNNMLAVIVASLALAKRRLAKGDADVLKFIDNAQDGADRAAALTRRLLAFSRRQPLAPVVIDLNSLVSRMAELLRRTIGERIEFACVVDESLWRTRVDPGQLENALVNLAVNGRDAMPEGGRLTIATANAYVDATSAGSLVDGVPGQYVMVTVSDQGVGMAPEVVARAFDPFFTTKEVGQGTGLGLSQVYGFVKQSGGHVKIDSEPGQGTSVKIYLPREFGESGIDSSLAAVSPTAPCDSTYPGGSASEIILVVEDEPAVRRISVDALRDLGYTVRHAASGQEALLLLQEQPGVRLLFTDVVMPGMTGRQLADVVRKRRPDLKVLFTTGYARDAIVHNGVIGSGVELLLKPFAIDALARKVRSLLDRSVDEDTAP